MKTLAVVVLLVVLGYGVAEWRRRRRWASGVAMDAVTPDLAGGGGGADWNGDADDGGAPDGGDGGDGGASD